MKTDFGIADWQALRAENYQEHFQFRQFASVHPHRDTVAKMVQALPAPSLNRYGAASFPTSRGRSFAAHSTRELDAFYALGAQLGIDAWMLLSWYWSDDGWAEFQRCWQALPETVR